MVKHCHRVVRAATTFVGLSGAVDVKGDNVSRRWMYRHTTGALFDETPPRPRRWPEQHRLGEGGLFESLPCMPSKSPKRVDPKSCGTSTPRARCIAPAHCDCISSAPATSSPGAQTNCSTRLPPAPSKST